MVLDKKAGRGKARPSRPKKRRFRGNQHTRPEGVDKNSLTESASNLHQEKLLPSTETLRQAILQLEEPVVFNNLLRDSEEQYLWKFLDWDLNDLSEKLGDLKLPFRIGLNAKTLEQQWDFKCKEKSMTMREFQQNVESSVEKTNEWFYFDYKYMHEWFNDRQEILSSIDWQRFGFNKQGADSTLWIGSKGAHTNCHQDSYGCNLIAQTHGRKRWILFPPDSSLRFHAKRIPYEESTVYTSFNFFCPSRNEEEDILKIDPRGRMVVLEPGQVLLVPSGWWHYVESVDLSISVNIWLPLAKDRQSRLGEAVVKLLVNEIGKGLISTSDKTPFVTSEALSLVETCIEQCNDEETETEPPEKRIKRIEWSAKELIEEYSSYVSPVPVLETREFKELLSENRNRFPDINCHYSQEEEEKQKEKNSGISDDKNSNESSHKKTTNILVNTLCHPDVIAKVTQLLLESSQSK